MLILPAPLEIVGDGANGRGILDFIVVVIAEEEVFMTPSTSSSVALFDDGKWNEGEDRRFETKD